MVLDSAWLQEDRKKGSNKGLEPAQSIDNIFWESQGMYGNPYNARNRKSKKRFNPHKNVMCWNCKKRGHLQHQCPLPRQNMIKNVYTAIRRNPRTVNKKLFEICQQYDASKPPDSDNSSDNDDPNDYHDNDNDSDPPDPSQNNIVKQLYGKPPDRSSDDKNNHFG